MRPSRALRPPSLSVRLHLVSASLLAAAAVASALLVGRSERAPGPPTALAIAGVLALVFVAQAWANRRLVHLPLARLRCEAARIAAAEPARADVEASGPAELRELAGALHALEATVARRREELERAVAERTRDLVGANEALARAARERDASAALLHQAQKMEAVGRLAGGVAHDFNNLLTAIAGATAEIDEALADGDPRREALEDIRAATSHANALTRQLLAVGRRDLAHPRVLDVNGVLAQSRRLLARLVREDVEIVLSPAAEAAAVRVDPVHLEQVIVNLVMNARDAMPGGGRVEVGVHLSDGDAVADPVARRPWVVLSVRDHGSGMDAETLAYLFEPFFTTKDRHRGSGLGLATVYSVVRAFEGHVFVDSTPGAGTEFRIWIPRVEAAVEAEPQRAALAPAASPLSVARERRGTALVVEDEAAVRRVVTRALERAGWEVLPAADGAIALEIARSRGSGVGLLVTDVVLPRLNGAELAARVASVCGELPVVYMSGYADDPAARRRITDGVFVQKPFTAAELAAAVSAAEARPRARARGAA